MLRADLQNHLHAAHVPTTDLRPFSSQGQGIWDPGGLLKQRLSFHLLGKMVLNQTKYANRLLKFYIHLCRDVLTLCNRDFRNFKHTLSTLGITNNRHVSSLQGRMFPELLCQEHIPGCKSHQEESSGPTRWHMWRWGFNPDLATAGMQTAFLKVMGDVGPSGSSSRLYPNTKKFLVTNPGGELGTSIHRPDFAWHLIELCLGLVWMDLFYSKAHS